VTGNSNKGRVHSRAMEDFARALQSHTGGPDKKVDVDPDNARNGLARLVLALIKLLHELLERQAIRRIDSGSLSKEQIERLGLTLKHQAEQLDHLREEFGFSERDLNLDLGPLGRMFRD